MRREERHHLKENPLAVFLTDTQAWLSERGRSLMIGAGIVVMALIAAGGYYAWTQIQVQRAGEALAEAMTVLTAPVVPPPETPTVAESTPPVSEPFEQPPGTYPSFEERLEAALPGLLAVADQYPRTQQGVNARYQAAAVLLALGRPEESVTHFRQVIDGSGEQLYRQMGLMGLAEAHLLSGNPHEAIALLESQTSSLDSLIPVDAVLMRLGRAYEQAGQPDDALAAFNRVVEEFPVSVYYADAQQAVDTLRQGSGGASSSGE